MYTSALGLGCGSSVALLTLPTKSREQLHGAADANTRRGGGEGHDGGRQPGQARRAGDGAGCGGARPGYFVTNVNRMCLSLRLTDQVNIAMVTTAVALGDLSQNLTIKAEGEVCRRAALLLYIDLRLTLLARVHTQLIAFASEVMWVTAEVATEGHHHTKE
ncbi:hypothetical protein GGX14DRAFT_662854 [Mycena pura]|uniref:Uncharacterized protein n=1 Tax=Mycena pura TaxID=153505 RepID=A0AAD6VVE6_9AGAR|nr:hypothetical protein GGX14DRAFT_662854 [Mycena pura]